MEVLHPASLRPGPPRTRPPVRVAASGRGKRGACPAVRLRGGAARAVRERPTVRVQAARRGRRIDYTGWGREGGGHEKPHAPLRGDAPRPDRRARSTGRRRRSRDACRGARRRPRLGERGRWTPGGDQKRGGHRPGRPRNRQPAPVPAGRTTALTDGRTGTRMERYTAERYTDGASGGRHGPGRGVRRRVRGDGHRAERRDR
ncbi:hypothetical protein ATKI12_4636 [Kitasatospora sp. Ki12]